MLLRKPLMAARPCNDLSVVLRRVRNCLHIIITIIISNDAETGDLERRMWLSNVRKLFQPRMSDTFRTVYAALSELIVSIRLSYR